jgi:hypothetical protein
VAYTDEEKAKIRHYCGFPDYGAEPLSNFWLRSTWVSGQLEFVMRAQSPEVEAMVRDKFLPNLDQLEQDIYGVRENSDTSRAAVWYRNKLELSERVQNYTWWRKRLCRLVGSYFGPDIMDGQMRIVV